MPTLPFYKYSPSGNMTILVPDMTHSPEAMAGLARQLMCSSHVGAEQVGFVNTSAMPPQLFMMGGELCVNACRSMASLLYAQDRLSGPDADGWHHGMLKSSGVEELLPIRARQVHPAVAEADPLASLHEAAVGLSLPHDLHPVELDPGIQLVRLPGIAHLVLDVAQHPVPDSWHTAAQTLRTRFALQDEEAVGCLWLNAALPLPHLTPVVWVRATSETVRESACGSGTLACALCLHDAAPRRLTETLHIQQWGGETLQVDITTSHDPCRRAWIGGHVHCVASGRAFVPDFASGTAFIH